MATYRPATAADVDRIFALAGQAFNISASAMERTRADFEPSGSRVIDVDGTVVAALRSYAFGHFYGGRAVTAAGVGGVAVAAEARGRGHGRAMMTEYLRELRADGVALSSLYPATVPIYRSVGYGFGGVRTFWKTKLATIPRARGLDVEPFGLEQAGEITPVYERIASGTNGLVQRTPWWWEKRVLSPWNPDDRQYRYLVREDGQITGWIVYTLEKAGGESWRSKMECRDLHWTTPEAARALLSLASLHRSTGESIEWVGPPVEPVADLFAEDTVSLEGAFRYMVRLLDVPAAIEARGYHPLIDARTTIAVHDPVFDENAGPWSLAVSGGSAKVAPDGPADATADVQTWASIFTSHLRPRDAVRQGALTASDDAIAALEAIFAGPSPWISDFY